jgi:flavorubredoxin
MLIDLNTGQRSFHGSQIFDDLYVFIWEDYTQNNCNTYLITGSKNILVDAAGINLVGAQH